MKNIFKKLLGLILVSLLLLTVSPRAEGASGNYADQRIAGEDRYATAVAISKQGWKNGANTLVLARGDLFADALSGVPLAHKLNAPILLTRSTKLPAATKQEIERLKVKKVLILGSTQAVSDSVSTTIKKLGIEVERIAGDDRYATSVAISKKVGNSGKKAIIATGENFPDALSIAPYAAEKGYPILLTRSQRLPKVVKDALGSYQSSLIIGENQTVGKEVEKSLPNPERIGGATRYQTASKIIEEKYDTNELIYVSTGEDFADALAGATLAAKQHTAVLIVGKNSIPVETQRLFPGNQIKKILVFGNEIAVSDQKVAELMKLRDKFSESVGVGVASEKAKLLEGNQKVNFIKAIEKAKVNQNTGIVQLNLPIADTKKYKKGDILILSPDDQFPTGLMVKVKDISESGLMTFTQPAIDELLPYFNINPKEVKLDASNLIDLDLEDGVTMEENGENIRGATSLKSFSANNFSAKATTPPTMKPFIFSINKKLYESDDKKTKVSLVGKLTFKEMSVDSNLERKWTGLPKSFDFTFDSKQDFSLTGELEAKDEFGTKDQSKEFEKGWFKASGVERDGRVSLATLTYQIGTVPVYGIGNAGYKEVPVGVTLFITANTKGKAKVTAKTGLNWSSKLNAKAEWKNGDFDTKTKLDTTSLKVTADAQGELKYSTGVGVEPALNLLGVLPLVVQNDLGQEINMKGSVNGNYSLYPDNQWIWNGCFNYTSNLDFTSKLKARLKAKAGVGPIEMGLEIPEYQKDFFRKDFFKVSKNLCAHSGKMLGVVKDAVSKKPISDAMINVYKNGEYVTSTKTSTDGSYEIELSDGSYTFTFNKSSYSQLTYNNVQISENIVKYSPELKLISSQYLGQGKVQGFVRNALNNEAVSGATINFRNGLNTKEGQVIKTVTSNNLGEYGLDSLPAGTYTGEVKKAGFISTSFTITVIGGKVIKNQDVNISPVLNNLETRVVLKWNETPKDLDSHLTGSSNGEERFHVFYNSKEYYEGDTLMAKLDRDDRDSFGPETITIHKQNNGVYRYSVHDYSNKDADNSYELSNSGAVVEVYKGNYLVKTFNVPANRIGTLWTVFELKGDNITPINTISNSNNSNNIRSFRMSSPSDSSVITNSLVEKK
ncbi:cell wall-binding repeat-containing protein [Priestia aryabhattai]|uniref:Cell wall-binding repeat-containing protein n=1 Tax=Priestia aryabhattai TaxID=412384 RepID=A0ABD7WZT8_PRIAR|nr:cell wall-binding repeat-containing protein [Priestia aryabhattai]MBY0025532.1 cell wall-binding repeat-containing protein [Priestia aryabhattai]WEA45885.1 cell wall-binding repeat-containing protein [Priestia aryabhattai]